MREALYEELLADEARTLHRRIAGHLEKLPESEERTIELAYHWWAAREPAKAVQYNEAAAEIAAARFASENAVRYYDRALEFVEEGTLIQAELAIARPDSFGRRRKEAARSTSSSAPSGTLNAMG